tara:strand:+ start:1112 stop:1504 length:393 start_codon:yes stop_codon:yes gene_type:complete
MRSLIIIIVLFLFFNVVSTIFSDKIPGITDNPSLGKIKLCDVASGMHKNFIDKYVNDGIIVGHSKVSEQKYRIIVNKEKWSKELQESQEVAAIGGWCKVASKGGIGQVEIFDSDNNNLIGTVINGNYEII